MGVLITCRSGISLTKKKQNCLVFTIAKEKKKSNGNVTKCIFVNSKEFVSILYRLNRLNTLKRLSSSSTCTLLKHLFTKEDPHDSRSAPLEKESATVILRFLNHRSFVLTFGWQKHVLFLF